MTRTIRVKRLRGSSIFKLCLIGSVIGFTVLCIVFSGPAYFGVEILSWNNEYITGPIVIIAGPLLGVFIGVLFGLFLGLFTYAGLRVYSCFRVLELEYVPVDAE